MIEERIDRDLKTAMLARDTTRVDTLRMVKSVILSSKVNSGKRDTGLSDDEVIALLSKEAKKRQESADLYVQGGNQAKADAELAEKAIIETYLPAQLSSEELAAVVDSVIAEIKPTGPAAMGQIIGAVKSKVGASADGALIAQLVREKLA